MKGESLGDKAARQIRDQLSRSFQQFGALNRSERSTRAYLREAILEPFGLSELDSYMASSEEAVEEIRRG